MSKGKNIKYEIRINGNKFKEVIGRKINSIVGTREINKKWIVDHIPTGGKIFICDSLLEAKIIGLAFFQACSKSLSKSTKEVIENTDERFKDFLYNKEFKKFVDFIGYTTSLQTNKKKED